MQLHKRLLSFLLVFAMVLTLIPGTAKAEGTKRFNIAVQSEDNELHGTIEYKINDGLWNNIESIEKDRAGNRWLNNLSEGDMITVRCKMGDDYTIDMVGSVVGEIGHGSPINESILYTGESDSGYAYTITSLEESELMLCIIRAGQQGPGPGPQQGPENAVDISVSIDGTSPLNGKVARILIDGYEAIEGIVPVDSTKETHIIEVQMEFLTALDTLTVNGEAVELETLPEDTYRTEVAHNADGYVLGGTLGTGDFYTIVWGNAGAKEDGTTITEDSILTHGSARIVDIIDRDGHHADFEDNWEADDNGHAMVSIEKGSHVIFEFIPEYGYQLTSIKANGTALAPQDEVNLYEYIMPETNIHFSAEFTKVEDEVLYDSETISGGTVEIANDVLDAGTAVLTVLDSEPEATRVSKFEAEADGYTIDSYMDIDFYQVFYKGEATLDMEDPWFYQFEQLSSPATITLALEEDYSEQDIVLVHNIHNSEEYELVEVKYDEEANTITFEADSFSTYAIASKAKETKPEAIVKVEKDAPKTTTTSLTDAYITKLLDTLKKDETFSAMLATGLDCSIELKVANGKDAPEADKALVEKALSKDMVVGQYLDINLLLVVDGVEKKITDTNKQPVKIEVELPTDLLNKDTTKTRTYSVIRVHEGKAETLPTTYKNGKITFETSQFSTYAIVYTDAPITTAPATGDHAMMHVVGGVLLTASAAFVLLKKKED